MSPLLLNWEWSYSFSKMQNCPSHLMSSMFVGEASSATEAQMQGKEWEHTMLQENLDKELQELNKRLEQKEVT